VDETIRAAVDLQLDGGPLPGTPSSVVDLGAYEETGDFRLLREGAVAEREIRTALKAPL
jgi:tRNA A37 threonylcarbamoyladenosine synthetase subunit TsaC/SUA5/YrdC